MANHPSRARKSYDYIVMHIEVTEIQVAWGLWEVERRINFADWSNPSVLLDRVDVGRHRRYSRWVIRINLECSCT